MKFFLIFFFLVSFFGTAQRSKIDSLLMTRDYLSEILSTVNANDLGKNEQLQKLKIMIKQASAKERKFKSGLKEVIPTESPDYKTMTDRFHWILQSVALYRSDISSNENGLSEKRFLNQNIPPLIDKINYHGRLFEEKINFKTH